MQLQRSLNELSEAGIKVYGVSYDTVDELKSFADQYGITYDLLSDENSEVIKRFGILNTLVEKDSPLKSSTGRSFYGMPYPGSYVVNSEGVVVEKFFNRSYASRHSSGTLLTSALGELFQPEAVAVESLAAEYVQFEAFLLDPELKLEYISTLVVRAKVAEGFHAYAEPLPEGFFPTTVTVVPTKGLTVGKASYPTTRRKAFPELEVELPVFEGDVEITIPIRANADVLNWTLPNKPDAIAIPITINYQVCSESICYLPQQETLSLEVPLGPMIR